MNEPLSAHFPEECFGHPAPRGIMDAYEQDSNRVHCARYLSLTALMGVSTLRRNRTVKILLARFARELD